MVPHEAILEKSQFEAAGLDKVDVHKRERFVIVVGSEASHIATDGYMPLPAEAKKQIKAFVNKRGKISDELIEEEVARLEETYRLKPKDLETYLLSISKFSRKLLTDALKDICDFNYCLSLEYEILAHMLKHRFVDVIINFNYDNILDTAIREEVNEGEYKFIFSDGHCPDDYDELLVGNRLKQPIYVKPHGSIDYRSSLRFTREDFMSIPRKLRETMDKLLAAEIDKSGVQKQLSLNLIVIGHSIISFDFVSLLQRYLHNNPEQEVVLWVFNHSDDEIHLRKSLQEGTSMDEEELAQRLRCHYFPLSIEKNSNTGGKSLKRYLTELWRLIEDNFKDNYKPQGIIRHELLDRIFKADKDTLSWIKNKGSKSYLKSRFYVELAIAILSSDGILNTKQILEDRAGKYFTLYKEKVAQEGDDNDFSLREACEKMGLISYKRFIKDTFTWHSPSSFHSRGDDLFMELCHSLEKRISSKFKKNIKHNKDKEELCQLFRGIKKRNLLKITSNFKQPHEFMFSTLKEKNILNTSLSWIYKFHETVRNRNKWDLILAISEKGRFLKYFIDKGLLKGKQVELVLSSFDMKDFDDLSEERCHSLNNDIERWNGELKFLPWYLHNRHMVLFLKKGTRKRNDTLGRWQLIEGYYYENRMLSRRANPVRIENNGDDTDLMILLEIFANYWYRAKEYTLMEGPKKSVPIIADEDELRGHIRELLKVSVK